MLRCYGWSAQRANVSCDLCAQAWRYEEPSHIHPRLKQWHAKGAPHSALQERHGCQESERIDGVVCTHSAGLSVASKSLVTKSFQLLQHFR